MGKDEGTTFAEDIEEVAGDEPIEAVVVGAHGDAWFEKQEKRSSYQVLTWKEARAQLDYEYDDGFGGADCHAIYAWTQTRVLFVSEYDGSTTIASVPRNPTESKPIFP